MAALSIVIVTYNSSHVVLGCLDSIAYLAETEVIVFDNASVDDTVDAVRRKFPMVTVIEGTSNFGFAVGVNRAVEVSTAPTIMLLNPDAVIAEASIRELSSTLAARPNAVVAPMITHPHGLVKVASAGHFPTPSAMLSHYSGLSRLPFVRGHYLLLADDSRERLTEVQWVSGACLMTSRSTWEAVGGLDERWFMYAEDIDFCWRVVQSGGVVLLDSGSTATHLVGESDGARSGVVNSMWVENLYEFYALRMSSNRMSTITWGCVVSAGLFVRSIVFLVQRRLDSAREFRAHSRAVVRHMRVVDG